MIKSENIYEHLMKKKTSNNNKIMKIIDQICLFLLQILYFLIQTTQLQISQISAAVNYQNRKRSILKICITIKDKSILFKKIN